MLATSCLKNTSAHIFSKVGSVPYKLGPEQAADNHPKNERHVILCDLMRSIRHFKSICTIDVGVLSHQLSLTMNGFNYKIIL